MAVPAKPPMITGTVPPKPATRVVARSLAPETLSELQEIAAQVGAESVTERETTQEFHIVRRLEPESRPDTAILSFDASRDFAAVFSGLVEDAGPAGTPDAGPAFLRFLEERSGVYAANQAVFTGRSPESGNSLTLYV